MAMDKEMLRSEVAEQYKWQTQHVYASLEAWEADFLLVKGAIEKLSTYSGKLGDGRTIVAEALGLYNETKEMLIKLYVYAQTNLNVDNSDPGFQGLSARVQSLAAQCDAGSAFVTPEMLELDPAVIEGYIADPAFADYDVYLKGLVHMKPYTLSTQMEEVLAASQEALSGASNAYDMFTYVDMKLGKARNEEGKLIEMTNARYGSMIQSENRAVRRGAFERMFKSYGAFGSTFAALYAASVKGDVFTSKTRGYASTRMAHLYPDEIPESVYDSLIDAVHEAIPALDGYIGLHKKAQGITNVHLYDLYTPLTGDFKMEIKYDQAYDELIEAVAVLGSDYQDVLRQARTGGWIDVHETKNKSTGAYSNGGAYAVHPYVLLNYREEIDGLLTLAHEMGHAMHSYYSNGTQPFAKSDYTIFVAEVASTCNEVLTIEYLRKKYKGNKQAQASLIGRMLEMFRTTVFRQTLFAEFEHKAHVMEESGEPLTCETLSNMYYDLNKLYYGGSCKVDKLIANEWMRIPHFYSAYYVYQYATGFCAAVALAKRILEQGEDAVRDYRKFLSLGGSMTPIEELKVAGVDMSTPEPVEAALNYFAELTADLSEMLH